MRTFLTATLVLCSSLAAWAQFEHPDLKSGKRHVRSVVLMPVRAEISRVSMKGPEPMTEESRRVEKDLLPVVSEVMKNLGCSVQEVATGAAADPELSYTVDDLQKQFDAAMGQMVKKSKDVRKGRFSLGDSVTRLAAGESADALVFVRAEGQVLTGGKKAFGFIVGGPAFDMVQIDIGIVDARNGDVLYFAKPFLLKNLAKDPADARSGLEKSFRNFAKANGTAPATATAAATTTDKPLAAASSSTPAATATPASSPSTTAAAAEAPAAATPQPPGDGLALQAATTEPAATVPASHFVAPTASPDASARVDSVPPAATSGPTVYVFVQRTNRHVKYSDAAVFTQAIDGLAEYLKAKNVALVTEMPGTLTHSDLETPMDKVLAAARYAKAESVLWVSVDRPVTKWIEFKVQCLDTAGKELWKAAAGSGGGFSGGHGLRVGLEHLRAELDKHLGQPGLPVQPSH